VKNSKIAFRALAASLLLTGVCHLTAKAQSSNNWLEQASGSYQSRIFSVGSLISGTTEFRQARDGTLAGSYTMNELGKSVPGTLSECQATQIRVINCIWNDQYGSGNLEVTFSEDFSSFNGYWGEESAEPVFRWSGLR
jgi:hypothetical protein